MKHVFNKILVKDEPIKNFASVCFLGIIISLASGFIHKYISVLFVIFGYSLIIMRQYRFDKRRGLDPLSFTPKENRSNLRREYNKQEKQLATIGLILFVLSLFSSCVALYYEKFS